MRWMILAAVLVLATVARGEDKPATVDPEAYRIATERLKAKAATQPSEVDRLKAEVASLRRQVVQLQKELAVLKPAKSQPAKNGLAVGMTFAEVSDLMSFKPDDATKVNGVLQSAMWRFDHGEISHAKIGSFRFEQHKSFTVYFDENGRVETWVESGG